MHELSVVESLVEGVREHVPAGARLISVTIEVGTLEHLDGEIMQMAWESTIDQTPLRDATLNVERIPVEVRCRACGAVYAPLDAFALACPECDQVLPDVINGRGIVLRSLEIETADDTSGHEAGKSNNGVCTSTATKEP